MKYAQIMSPEAEKAIIARYYSHEDPSHGYEGHIAPVRRTAAEIAAARKLDPASIENLDAAALLHDITRGTDTADTHHLTGAAEAAKVLRKLKVERARIDEIKDMIASHRASTEVPEGLSEPAMILRDADRVAETNPLRRSYEYHLHNITPGNEDAALMGALTHMQHKYNPETGYGTKALHFDESREKYRKFYDEVMQAYEEADKTNPPDFSKLKAMVTKQAMPRSILPLKIVDKALSPKDTRWGKMLQKLDRFYGEPPIDYVQHAKQRLEYAPGSSVLHADTANGVPAGMAGYAQYNKTIQVFDLYVEPRLRGKGIGQALIGKLKEKVLANKELKRIRLSTGENSPANKFYLGQGFEPTKVQPDKGHVRYSLPRRKIKTAADEGWIGLKAPADVRKALLKLHRSIDRKDLAEDGCDKDPHVTVAYGIAAKKNPMAVRSLVRKTLPVDAKLGPLTAFKNDDATVLKFDIRSYDLRQLRKRVEDKLGIPGDTHGAYRPHMTVAYLKPGTDIGKYKDLAKGLTGKEMLMDKAEYSNGKVEMDIELGQGQKAAAYRQGLMEKAGGVLTALSGIGAHKVLDRGLSYLARENKFTSRLFRKYYQDLAREGFRSGLNNGGKETILPRFRRALGGAFPTTSGLVDYEVGLSAGDVMRRSAITGPVGKIMEQVPDIPKTLAKGKQSLRDISSALGGEDRVNLMSRLVEQNSAGVKKHMPNTMELIRPGISEELNKLHNQLPDLRTPERLAALDTVNKGLSSLEPLANSIDLDRSNLYSKLTDSFTDRLTGPGRLLDQLSVELGKTTPGVRSPMLRNLLAAIETFRQEPGRAVKWLNRFKGPERQTASGVGTAAGLVGANLAAHPFNPAAALWGAASGMPDALVNSAFSRNAAGPAISGKARIVQSGMKNLGTKYNGLKRELWAFTSPVAGELYSAGGDIAKLKMSPSPVLKDLNHNIEQLLANRSKNMGLDEAVGNYAASMVRHPPGFSPPVRNTVNTALP